MNRKIPVGVPTGVNITAILTLFSSIVFGFLSFSLGFQNFVNLAFAGAGETITSAILNVYLVFVPMFTIFGIAASAVLLFGNRSKLLWYAMIIYMVTLFGYFVFYERNILMTYGSTIARLLSGSPINWEQFGGMNLFIETGIAYLTPFLFSLSCIRYLFTKSPKRYFCIE